MSLQITGHMLAPLLQVLDGVVFGDCEEGGGKRRLLLDAEKGGGRLGLVDLGLDGDALPDP